MLWKLLPHLTVVRTKPLRIFTGCLKAQRHWEVGGEGRFASNCLQGPFAFHCLCQVMGGLAFFWEMASAHSLKKRECLCHLLQRYTSTGGDWRATRRGTRSSLGCFGGRLLKKGAVLIFVLGQKPEWSVVLSWLEARNASVFGAYCLGLLSYHLFPFTQQGILLSGSRMWGCDKPGAHEYLVGRTTGLTRSPLCPISCLSLEKPF